MSDNVELPEPGNSRDLITEGPAGRLQARLSMPDSSAQPAGAALICHPHPNYGGSMDNKVADMLARACDLAGLAALRFNFRGVGKSEGDFGEGQGEIEDCLAMAKWLESALPESRIVLAGFSFGAYVSVCAAGTIKPVQLISVAPPIGYFGGSKPPLPPCPWLVIQGDADDVVDPERNIKSLRALETPPDIRVMEGVGHFFHGKLVELRTLVRNALEKRWNELGNE